MMLSALGFTSTATAPKERAKASIRKPSAAAPSGSKGEGEDPAGGGTPASSSPPIITILEKELFECDECEQRYTNRLLRAISEETPWSPRADELRKLACVSCKKQQSIRDTENSTDEVNQLRPGDMHAQLPMRKLAPHANSLMHGNLRRLQQGKKSQVQHRQPVKQSQLAAEPKTKTKRAHPASTLLSIAFELPLFPSPTSATSSDGESGSEAADSPPRHYDRLDSIVSPSPSKAVCNPGVMTMLGGNRMFTPNAPDDVAQDEAADAKEGFGEEEQEDEHADAVEAGESAEQKADDEHEDELKELAGAASSLSHQVSSLKAWVENTPEKFSFRTFNSGDGGQLKPKTVESMARPWTPTAKKMQSKREEWDRLCSKFLQYLDLSDLCMATQACRPWAKLVAQHRLKRRCVLHSAVPKRVRRFFWQHSAPCRPRRERSQYQQLLKREQDLRLGFVNHKRNSARINGSEGSGANTRSTENAENKPDNSAAKDGRTGEEAGEGASEGEAGAEGGGKQESGGSDSLSPNSQARKQQVLQCYEQFVEINADVRRTFGRSGMKVRDAGKSSDKSGAAEEKEAGERKDSDTEDKGETASDGSSSDGGGDSSDSSGDDAGRQSCFMTAVDGYRLQDYDDSKISVAEKQRRLRNVLLAYSTLNEEVGYCQGMNYLVSMLLSNVEWEEEEAFWLLVLLMEHYEMLHIYRPGMQHLELRFHQFERLLEQHMPKLHAHLDEHGLHPSMFASGWFITLFSNFNTLPPPVVAHILDVFFMDGWKIIFRVALAIMAQLQEGLLTHDLEGMIRIFYNFSLNGSSWQRDSSELLGSAMEFKITETALQSLAEEFAQIQQKRKNRRSKREKGKGSPKKP